MEKIIDPVSVSLLKAELTPDKKLCDTNKAGNEIYVIDGNDSPNVLREVGRLREESFRQAGGSSGLSLDLDEFDIMDSPYRQIVIWDPSAEAIIGGYRYILGPDVTLKENGQPNLATSHMFHFSDKFIRDYLPHVIELGRSFVTPAYQSSKAGAKAIYALDNLWDGIASVMMQHSNIIYFFGKMTMYPSYDRSCRDLILHFLWKHFGDDENLVRPYHPVMPQLDGRILDLILRDDDFKTDYRNLKDAVRKLGCGIPPLVNSYMNISPTMKMCGTAVNDEFSDVEETAILVCFNEMYADKRDRHKEPYIKQLVDNLFERFPQLNREIAERLSLRKDEKRSQAFSHIMEKIKKK